MGEPDRALEAAVDGFFLGVPNGFSILTEVADIGGGEEVELPPVVFLREEEDEN